MHKKGKLLIADACLSFLLGIKLGDLFTVYLVKLLEKILGKLSAGQIGIIFLNYDTFNRILMILFGIVFCTFGLSIGLLIDRLKQKE